MESQWGIYMYNKSDGQEIFIAVVIGMTENFCYLNTTEMIHVIS